MIHEMETKNFIEIYTLDNCSYGKKAKTLFDEYGIQYIEYDVKNDKDREIMKKRANGNYMVPQIFINNDSIGGFDELKILHIRGKLKSLLS